MSDITVITPAIPKRLSAGMLDESLRSIRNQELQPHAHLVHVDYEQAGTVAALNRMLPGVETEFLCVLADDDVFYPNHLRLLREAIGDKALAYSWCDCGGQIGHVTDGSEITASALVRTEAVREAGGWRLCPKYGNSREDYRMWQQILVTQKGGFVCVPEITRHYRFHGDNQSRNGIQGTLGKRVYVGGTFDCFHPGHARLLEQAARLGPVTVSLNTDEFAARYKRRPVYTLAERTEIVRACRWVDRVIVNEGGEDSRPAILASGAELIVHGDDWTGEAYLDQLGVSQEWLGAHALSVVYLPYTPGISTSEVIERWQELSLR